MSVRDYLFGGVTRTMAYKGLDASTQRGRAISQNLANAQTPNYQRKEVTFEEELRKVLKIKLPGERTHQDHMPITQAALLQKVEPQVFESPDQALPGQINNVDVDLEAAKLAEAQIMYRYMLKFTGFGSYRVAITGNPE